MRKIISLIFLLLPVLAFAAGTASPSDIRLNIRGDAPDRHVVVKGDTLWDISGKFFKDPWKWPHIWGLNKDTIKDPHWIYPGDVIYLDRTNGTLNFGQPGATAAASGVGETGNTVVLYPKVRVKRSDHDAIPSIPASAIGPFLTRPLIIEEDEFKKAPMLIGAREGRVILGNDDTAFVTNLPANKGDNWQIYRPGKTFVDPDTNEVLGIEAIYLGDAEVTHFAKVSTITITHAVEEINAGDRLVLHTEDETSNYLPRAPAKKISARVISIYGGVSQGGQNSVITLNRGARNGVEKGYVLALYHKGEVVTHDGKQYTLPDERYGLVFVFRVFNKVSYALVMETRLPVQLLDSAKNP
ncbi:MAG: LysM peptidoglycan-binding domain-containing protein [Gallionella sp.]|nr:LysM peptidoglycan-binding domain-containing protein [Gallionella sp.]